MPGEFYIEGKKEKVDLSQILANQSQILANQDEIESRVDSVRNQINKLAGETPGEGSTTADWQAGEADVVSIGASGVRNKIHAGRRLDYGRLAGRGGRCCFDRCFGREK